MQPSPPHQRQPHRWLETDVGEAFAALFIACRRVGRRLKAISCLRKKTFSTEQLFSISKKHLTRTTLQSRMAFVMCLLSLVSVLSAVCITAALLYRGQIQSVQQQLQDASAGLVSLGIAKFAEVQAFEDLNAFIESSLKTERMGKIIRIFDTSGKLFLSSVDATYDLLPTRLEKVPNKPIFLELEGDERRYESIVVPYRARKSNRPYFLQVAMPLPRFSSIVFVMWRQGATLLLALMVASVSVAKILSKKLLRPVDDIARYLQSIEPAKVERWHPLELSAHFDYLNAIAEAINAMGQRTCNAILHIRRMSRYVAHELRTPLTIIQGEAETALLAKEASKESYETVIRSSLEEVKRMSDIVNIVLSVGDDTRAHERSHRCSCDLLPWCQDAKSRWEKTLGRSFAFHVEGSGPYAVFVDPHLLFRLIDNIVRNVRVHVPPDTDCTMKLFRTGDTIGIAISDEGPGLSEGMIASLNAQGSGSPYLDVGLHLCFRIAEMLKIQMTFAKNSKGGLDVVLHMAEEGHGQS